LGKESFYGIFSRAWEEGGGREGGDVVCASLVQRRRGEEEFYENRNGVFGDRREEKAHRNYPRKEGGEMESQGLTRLEEKRGKRGEGI